jgi:hypothetical protein
MPTQRQYKADWMFHILMLNATFAADNYVGRVLSSCGNRYAFVVAHPNGFCAAYPQPTKDSTTTSQSLRHFINDYGVPRKLIVDGAPEFTGRNGAFAKRCNSYDIDLQVTEPHTPKQNPAEGVIREIRRKWYRLKQQRKVPARLWDYAITWICEIAQLTDNTSIYARERTPLQSITGETPDISEHLGTLGTLS